jgi:hypothetical protein
LFLQKVHVLMGYSWVVRESVTILLAILVAGPISVFTAEHVMQGFVQAQGWEPQGLGRQGLWEIRLSAADEASNVCKADWSL